MTTRSSVKKVEKLVIDNSPALLTAIGVTGTITTALLTGKATWKAKDVLDRYHNDAARRFGEDYEPPSLKKDVELVWKIYVPAAGVGLSTIVCIVLANRIGNRRAAAVAAAYTISEKAFVEYKEKVIEKIGENKEREIRDDLAQDRVNRNPPVDREIIVGGSGDVLCYEHYTGRYFESSMEKLKKAQNDLNYRVINDCYASLTDFYNFLGIPRTSTSDEVGWSSNKLLELEFSTVLSEDGRPCIAIDYQTTPIRDYDSTHI